MKQLIIITTTIAELYDFENANGITSRALDMHDCTTFPDRRRETITDNTTEITIVLKSDPYADHHGYRSYSSPYQDGRFITHFVDVLAIGDKVSPSLTLALLNSLPPQD